MKLCNFRAATCIATKTKTKVKPRFHQPLLSEKSTQEVLKRWHFVNFRPQWCFSALSICKKSYVEVAEECSVINEQLYCIISESRPLNVTQMQSKWVPWSLLLKGHENYTRDSGSNLSNPGAVTWLLKFPFGMLCNQKYSISPWYYIQVHCVSYTSHTPSVQSKVSPTPLSHRDACSC